MLRLHEVCAGYGRTEVLHSVDLSVDEGEILTIIGANGAGKSTLLKAISGVVRISSGSIEFAGERIDALEVEGIVARRLVQIPEGRRLFAPLSVQDNLTLGAYSRRREGHTRRRADGESVRHVSEAEGATKPAGGHFVGRRAADAGHRAFPYGRASASFAG